MKILVPGSARPRAVAEAGWVVAADEPAEAGRLLAEARLVVAAWDRSFQGQARGTRDVERLRELVERLALARIRLGVLAQHSGHTRLRRHVPSLDERLRLLTTEAEQVRAAYGAGDDVERVERLAVRLDDQLAAYAWLVAGRPRVARRPALLGRLEAALRGIDAGLEAAVGADPLRRAGLRSTVRAQLATVSTERQVLRAVHRDLGLGERVRAVRQELEEVGGEAERALAEPGVDHATLDALAERLDEHAHTLAVLAHAHDDEEAWEGFERAAGWLDALSERRRTGARGIVAPPDLGPLI